MKEFLESLVDFIINDHREIPQFYYDALLNYLAVTLAGSKEEAVDIAVNTFKTDYDKFFPLGRDENLSLSYCILIDCLSSSILAYDDIHFATTLHPCGVIASGILGYSRIRQLSLKKVVEALYIGMEVECRLGLLLFDGHSTIWYPTGIVGGIGVAAALSRLLGFHHEQVISALSLAATYASGVRGSHGSMAGSYVPAIAAKNGYEAVMLVKNGFTCSMNALIGDNGLLLSINKDIKPRYFNTLVSMETSCKPFPLGFISYPSITALMDKNIGEVEAIRVEVSSMVYRLNKNDPMTLYDAFVSLPYIIAKMIDDPDSIYQPINKLSISKKVRNIMNKISIIDNNELSHEEVKIYLDDKLYNCHQAKGSPGNPMSHDEIINKAKRLVHIDNKYIYQYYHDNIDNIYEWVNDYAFKL